MPETNDRTKHPSLCMTKGCINLHLTGIYYCQECAKEISLSRQTEEAQPDPFKRKAMGKMACPVDEEKEAVERRRKHRLFELCDVHIEASNTRHATDMEHGEEADAYRESQLTLEWVRTQAELLKEGFD